MEKLKAFWLKVVILAGKVSAFAKKTWKFLKKWGLQLVNLLVVILAYAGLPKDSVLGVIVGFWLFLLIVYYVFWESFGADELFKKNEKKGRGTPIP